jgi:hypothetical protein
LPTKALIVAAELDGAELVGGAGVLLVGGAGVLDSVADVLTDPFALPLPTLLDVHPATAPTRSGAMHAAAAIIRSFI